MEILITTFSRIMMENISIFNVYFLMIIQIKKNNYN